MTNIFQIIPVLLVSGCALSGYVHATDYFVSTSGKDSNSGTLSSPWRSIQKAAQTVPAGSTVNILGGTYNERIVVQVSGSAAGGVITFQNYANQKVIVQSPGQVFSSPDSFPVGLFQIVDKSFITLKGLEFTNYIGQAAASAGTFPAGIYVGGASTNIKILNNIVHKIYGSSNGKSGAHGIAVYGTHAPASANTIMIDGNTLYDLKLGQSESMVFNGNVDGFSATNNIIHDTDNIGIDAIGFEKTAPDPAFDQARNGLIAGNLIYNIDSNKNPSYPPNSNGADGIYVDGGKLVTIERNTVHHTNIGIEMASEHTGLTTSGSIARNNIIYSNYGPGISIGGYSAAVGGTVNCTVIGNILYGNDTRNLGGGELQLQFFLSGTSLNSNLVADNMFSPTKSGVLISNASTFQAVTFKNNLYDLTLQSLSWSWKNKQYNTLSAFQVASGSDQGSLVADPAYVNRSTLDLRPQSTSPAKGKGTYISSMINGDVDFGGNPRLAGAFDIGAYEQ